MNLRQRLVVGVAVVVAIVSIGVGIAGGIEMYEEVEELLDQELVQIAYMAQRAQLLDDPGPGSLRGSRFRDGELAVQRWDNDALVSFLPTRAVLPRPSREGFDYVEGRRGSWRRYSLRTEQGWVTAAQRTDARYELTAGAVTIAVVPVILGVPLIGILIFFVVGRTLAPLHRITNDLKGRRGFSAEPLDVAGAPDEIRPLLEAFNGLLQRVRAGIERERTFVTDAAHALRTPVTALQLQAETLAESPSQREYDERLSDLISGIDRTRHTLEQLLALARAGNHASGQAVVLEALQVLPDAFRIVLGRRGIALKLESEGVEAMRVPLRQESLAIALQNLVDNALRYAPAGTTVTVGASGDGDRCRIWVRDEGPGLNPDEMERVFDRFYRSTDDTTAGTGLGLSIVRAIVTSAGGAVHLERNPAGAGLVAVISLPASRFRT